MRALPCVLHSKTPETGSRDTENEGKEIKVLKEPVHAQSAACPRGDAEVTESKMRTSSGGLFL